MVQESFDYILNIEHRTNKTGVLLAIPMYMYRIETLSIEYGINFFQKAVLMLKTKPEIDNKIIANCLGLDLHLVNTVAEQLVNMRLIGSDGLLTEKGQEMKNDIDGLVVDEKRKSIGYVFQHINDDDLYPFYVNKINKASVLNDAICTGTKGNSDDEDYYVTPIRAEKLLKEKRTNPVPSERDIIGLIRRSNKHAHTNKEVDTLNIDEKKYGITYVPDNHPKLVWICTYAYVPHIGGDIYGRDWDIQDPFGFENNSELKFYVESLISDDLIDDFTSKFRNLKTVNDQTIDEFQNTMEDLVGKAMDKEFDVGYHKLDKNLVRYLKVVLKNRLLLNRKIEFDVCCTFVSNIQKAFETIFKLDFEQNEPVYRRVKKEIKNEFIGNGKPADFFTSQSKCDYMDELFDVGGCKADIQTVKKIKSFITQRFDPYSAHSLKPYLVVFLFAHKYNQDNPLYDIIREKVGIIYKIADLRNLGDHGQTSTEPQQAHELSEEEIEEYFGVLKQIINNYIVNCNGKE